MGAGTFRSVLRWTLVLAAVAFVLLLGSGLYLIWNYRPGEALSWDGASGPRRDSLPFRIRDVHRWSAVLFVALTFVAGFVAELSGDHQVSVVWEEEPGPGERFR